MAVTVVTVVTVKKLSVPKKRKNAMVSIQMSTVMSTQRRRLAYSRTLCDNAGNDASRRLADLMARRWFDELGITICGCTCLDAIQIGDTNDEQRTDDPANPE